MKTYYIYIMASKRNGTLYIGVTNDLLRRVWQHKNDVHEGFTKQYGVHRLVWYESTTDVHSAIQREKQMKKWRRQWKINLIEEKNPNWDDLFERLRQVQRPECFAATATFTRTVDILGLDKACPLSAVMAVSWSPGFLPSQEWQSGSASQCVIPAQVGTARGGIYAFTPAAGCCGQTCAAGELMV